MKKIDLDLFIENIKAILFIFIFLICFYWIIASNVFLMRNPKANSTTPITHIMDVLQFQKLEKFQ